MHLAGDVPLPRADEVIFYSREGPYEKQKALFLRFISILTLAVTTLAVSAVAQDEQPAPPPPPEQANTPASVDSAPVNVDQDRGNPAKNPGAQPTVARLSLIHGEVSMQRGDSGDWSSVHAELAAGARAIRSQPETVHTRSFSLDYANIIRLSSRAQVKIADLTRSHIQIQVAQGYTNYSMLKGSECQRGNRYAQRHCAAIEAWQIPVCR